jgi:hypothetical protein
MYLMTGLHEILGRALLSEGNPAAFVSYAQITGCWMWLSLAALSPRSPQIGVKAQRGMGESGRVPAGALMETFYRLRHPARAYSSLGARSPTGRGCACDTYMLGFERKCSSKLKILAWIKQCGGAGTIDVVQ